MTSKIKFKKITAKNFRSVGNMPMSLQYDKSDKTLIVSSDNGAGKSTLSIWALYYALFGKSYKKGTTIGSLVNTASGKDSIVEVEFDAQGSEWVVRRGQKPAVFDIIRDGKRVEDEAALKDYQGYLESVIGMDEVAFTFIVALGPDKFVPFSQLTAGQRRAFVEQVLDITVISSMNDITKERVKAIKKEYDQVYYDISMLESRLGGRKRTLDILVEKKNQRLSSGVAELEDLKTERSKVDALMKQYAEKTEEVKAQLNTTSDARFTQVTSLISRFNTKMNDIETNIRKIESLDKCPTCKQNVGDEHKESIRTEESASKSKLEAPLKELEDEYRALKEILDNNVQITQKIAQLNDARIKLQSRYDAYTIQIKAAEAKQVDTNEDALIDSEKAAIVELEDSIAEKTKTFNEIKTKMDEHDVLLQVLKDDAAKAEIVKQYVPFLNRQINDYLDSMNLYIQMQLDEEFNMTMYAPNRKNQTIDNLSTGQLRRVDLAVLLAWREVSRSKASVSTNLLIMDEILENLSEQGVADFIELWDTKYGDMDINLFVISQRNAEFESYFDTTIKYALKDDRTVEI